MKRLWIFLLIAGIAITAVSAFQYFTCPGKGDPAPLFSLTSLDSKSVSLDGFRGRPILLHFFATWCGMCQQEFPSLVRLANDLEEDGLVILVISEDDSRDCAAVRTFAEAMKPSFPILLDADGKVADSFQSWAVPETFFIKRDGTIAWRHTGPISWDSEKARKMIKKLLAE